MGSVEPEPFRFEMADGCFGVGMVVQRHPFLAALGRAVERAWSPVKTHRVGFQRPDGITAAQDGGEVVRFLHVFEQHREIRHAVVEHGFQPLKPSRQQGHGRSVGREQQVGSFHALGSGTTIKKSALPSPSRSRPRIPPLNRTSPAARLISVSGARWPVFPTVGWRPTARSLI